MFAATFLARTLAGLAALFVASVAGAQAYPSKPVRIVVPFTTGGANDALARIVAARLQASLNQPFVVENRAGAGGTIGLASVAKSPADGYTLVIAEPGAYSINPSFMKNVGYDPVRDFVPVAALTELQLVIVANPATQIRSLKDLAGYGGGKNVAFGSAGVGTVQHLSMELLKRTMKLEMTHVAYKGGSPAMTDLIGGHLPILPVTVSTALQPANAGQVVPIAALGRARTSTFPAVPTATEQGYPLNVAVWQGIFAPAGTPSAVVELLNNEIRRAITTPEVRKAITDLGMEVTDMPREAFDRLVREDVKRWADVLAEANVKPE